jgi:hypothetical protein
MILRTPLQSSLISGHFGSAVHIEWFGAHRYVVSIGKMGSRPGNVRSKVDRNPANHTTCIGGTNTQSQKQVAVASYDSTGAEPQIRTTQTPYFEPA